MILSGEPALEDLQTAWGDLLAQYHSAIGDTATTMRFFLYKEMALLAITIREVYFLIECLRRRYHKFFHAQLDLLLECTIELDESDPQKYYANLNRYLKRSKSIQADIDLKKIEYESLKEGGKAERFTHEYYESMLITLTDHSKVHITDQISTFAYCERVRRFNKYVKSLKK